MQVSVESVIKAPREHVFERVMDVGNWANIVTAIDEIEILTPGPIGIGSRIRETRMMFGQRASEDMTFAEIEPGERFLLTAFSHGTQYRTEHIFSDCPEGTRLTVVFAGKPVSLVARMMAPLGSVMCGSLKKMLASDLADLKSTIEGST